MFDNDNEKKSAISGCRPHFFLKVLQLSVQFSQEMAPKCPITGQRKKRGCDGIFRAREGERIWESLIGGLLLA